MLILQEAQVQSLVEILKFYRLYGATKGKKKIRGETKKPDEQKSNKIKPRPVVAKSEGAG